MGNLSGLSAYLCGGMDRHPTGGVQWRSYVEQELLSRYEMKSFNPTGDKKIIGYEENSETRQALKDAIAREDYGYVYSKRKVRSIDLRAVEQNDCLIFNYNRDHSPTGSFEEFFLANHIKRPCLFVCDHGKKEVPIWIYWVLEHHYVFNNFDEMFIYLDSVNNGKNVSDRWVFFDRT